MERSRRSTSSSIPCLHSRSRQGGNAWCACQTPGSLPSADRRLNDPKTPESVFTSGLIQRCQFVHGAFAKRSPSKRSHRRSSQWALSTKRSKPFAPRSRRLCQRLPYAIVTMPHLRIDSKAICRKASPFSKSPALHLVHWSIPAFPTAENRAWDLPWTQLGQPYDKPGREP